jgi:hypothetical protein
MHPQSNLSKNALGIHVRMERNQLDTSRTASSSSEKELDTNICSVCSVNLDQFFGAGQKEMELFSGRWPVKYQCLLYIVLNCVSCVE